jgi:hypothetical protein
MPKLATDSAVKVLRAFGLRYPGAHTKSPWPEHLDLAVADKTFAYLSIKGAPFTLSCKLPHSASAALLLPFVTPTAWGLGKSGWVTASFDPRQKPPLEVLKAWIDESYRARAPKKLLASLAADGGKEQAPVRRKRAPAAKRSTRPPKRPKKSAASASKTSRVKRSA